MKGLVMSNKVSLFGDGSEHESVSTEAGFASDLCSEEVALANASKHASDSHPERVTAEEIRNSSTPILELGSYIRAVQAFATPLGTHANFPKDIEDVVRRIKAWDRSGQQALHRLQAPPVFRQVLDFGSVMFDTHRLLRAVNSKHIDDWLNSTDKETKAAFESWRRAFFDRYDAIRSLTADILLASDLSMFDHDPLQLFVGNIRKLANIFAGKHYLLGGIGVALGTAALTLRERRFLGRLISSQLVAAGVTFQWFRDWKRVQRVNTLAGEVIITRRHATQLRRAFQLLRDFGVTGGKADDIVLESLRQADRAASKPWKGLVKLSQVVMNSRVDPRAPDFIDMFRSLTSAPVQYTHTPGLEWVVRDYELGKRLLQMDGRIPEGSEAASLQQGRASVMPGIAKATPGATEFARKYFGPVESFLNSMVTADGTDHQRLRKPFMHFFSRRAVLDQAELVQTTVTMLLDHAEMVARKNQGAFDFKKDFAAQFPIRIICGMVGITGTDIQKIQRWTEESTRSMDTEAGVSIWTARRGQRSADQQRAFFGKMLSDARAGKPSSELVRTLAFDDTLSEAERISNLSVIIFAGFETTTGLLCKGLCELLKHPEQWTFLRSSLVAGPETTVDGVTVPDVELRWYLWAETEPRQADRVRRQRIGCLLAKSEPLRQRFEAIRKQEASLGAAIEEMLRWCAPGSIIPLTASRDIEVPIPRPMLVRGQQLQPGDTLRIARGETVTVAVDEINRHCPFGTGEFDRQGEGTFDISRTDNVKHLSFGVKHMCIGATLARENAKRALEGVIRRFPDLEMNGTPIPQDMELFNGLAKLPVRSRSISR